jgi:hypothetical protein
MEMGVVLQILSPAMEHGQKADLGTQMLRIGGDAAQGGGRGAKQDAVDDFLVLQGNGGDRVGNREDDMKIGNGQELGPVLCQPFRPSQGLTLVAVAIGAGVVTDPAMPAAVALVHVPAENRRAADLDGAHDPPLRRAHGVAMSLLIGWAMNAKNVGDFERRPAHRPLPSRQAGLRNEPALRS